MAKVAAASRSTGARKSSRKRRERLSKRVSGVLIGLGLVLIVASVALAAFNYRPYSVPTNSMEPTLRPGDRILAQRLDGARAGRLHRGDIVVFNDKQWLTGGSLVKRVIALGGDTVACCTKKGQLTVNGHAVSEPYLDDPSHPASMAHFSVHVPAGRLFLMGDNRDASEDSRAHLSTAEGTVPASAVVARVDSVLWPPSRIDLTKRTDAFHAAGLGAPSGTGPLAWSVWGCGLGVLVVIIGAVVDLAGWLDGRRR